MSHFAARACGVPARECGFVTVLVLLSAVAMPAYADDWPQWRGPTRDGVWLESGLLEHFTASRIEPLWRAEISSGYGSPTVADGRVFVMDRVVKRKQMERIHCFDAATGKKLWTREYDCVYRNVSYDAGPRASVTVDGKRAYALGSMGHLHCLNVKTGKVRWRHDLNKDYAINMPQWGIAAAPLVEKNLVIVQIGGKPGAGLVAFNKKTGKRKWKALADGASYSAPIMIDQAGKRVLVCYTAVRVVGLNPKNGKVYWEYPFPPTQMVIGIADPVLYDDYLFLTNFFDGSLLLKLDQDAPGISKVWHRVGPSERETDALQSIISTPLIMDDHVYGVDSYGELRCLDLKTGDRVWESLDAVPKARWATIHLVRNGDHVWMFNERGELIIADLSPDGYREISRAKLIDPTTQQLGQRGGVCWSHPAFANRHVFIRNDKELLCASLAATSAAPNASAE